MGDYQLTQIWDDAKKEYENETGRAIATLPQNVDAETLIESLHRHIRARENWDNEQRELWDALHRTGEWARPVVDFVMTLAAGVPMAGPAQVVLGALQVTIDASNGVSRALQLVLRILECLLSLSKRLRHYISIDLSPELREIMTRQLKVLLKVCAISTRQIQDMNPAWARTKMMAKHVFKKQDEITVLLDQLRRGIEDEALQTGAETFVAVKQSALSALTLEQVKEVTQSQVAELTRTLSDQFARAKKRDSFSFNSWFKPKGSEASRNEAVSFLNASCFAKNELDRHRDAAKVIADSLGNEDGLGSWLLQEELYKELKAGNQSKLLVSGMSGCGKSFLAHNVISDLETEKHYVGYYFFSRDADKSVTPAKALCTMASQIASRSSSYTRYLTEHCKQVDLGRFDIAWKSLFYDKLIHSQEARKHPVYLVIDAPGALSKADRASLCAKLQQIGPTSTNLRVVVFGRPEFREELGKDVPNIEVTGSKNGDDINQYVRAKLLQLNNLKRLPQESQARIANAVSRKADGLFVWAELALAEVERKNVSSENSISAILNNVPSGLEDALSHSLEQVAASLSPERLSELNCLLAWVSCVKVPLTLDLLDALHHLDGTYDGDVVNLRNRLLGYSTIFKLDVSDDVRLESHNSHGNSTPSLLTSDQNRFEDFVCRADPKFVSVSFCHTSVLDYIRSKQRRPVPTATTGSSKNPIQSILWSHQKISSCLMQLLLKQQETRDVTSASPYAERHWLSHLQAGVPPDSATRTLEVTEIINLTYKMLVNENRFGYYLWLRHLEFNHFNYDSAKSIQQILTNVKPEPLFKGQEKEFQKWQSKLIKENPLHVFDYAMRYCGRAWLKDSPPHVLSLKYAVAAIHHYGALRSINESKDWSVYPKNPLISLEQIESAARFYTGKHEAVWKCRVAEAMVLDRKAGLERSKKLLEKVKDRNIRWEADMALARLFMRTSQWDDAVRHAKAALKGLVPGLVASQPPSDGQAYYRFVFDCNKLIADCWKQKMKAMRTSDPSYNQYAMAAAEYMRRAVRLQPTDTVLLNEVISILHGVALRLMVEGTALDAEDFLHDEFYTSDEEEEEEEDTESDTTSKADKCPPKTSKKPSDTRSGLNNSKQRPGSEKRTLSEDSTGSSYTVSAHRHGFSKSSLGDAGFLQKISHGSDQGVDSTRESWNDGKDTMAEASPGLASPRLYFDNHDDTLNSYICYSKIMTLLQDLDEKFIVGHPDDDGFDFRINNEHNRLYKRLSQVLQRDPKMVKIMAFAACSSDPENMQWFIKLFENAVVFSGQMKRERELMFVDTHLGTILSVYAGRHDDAIRLWENVVGPQLAPNREAGLSGHPQVEALKNLSKLCISMASSNPAKADEYIEIVKRYSDAPQALLLSQVGTERAQSKLHLATWYHNQEDHEEARRLVRDEIIWALNILTDEDPTNDFDGFYVLANALRAVQDDKNHLAARHAMRQYAEDDSAISTADKKQKITNNTDAFCSGLCLQEHKQWDNMMLCRKCPDLNFCPNCFKLFQKGDLYLKICNPKHEFLQVPRMKHSFTRGNQVVVNERVVELDKWVDELRKQWQVTSNPDPSSRWRRHSSMPLGSEEKVRTERKRDTFKRLFSHDRVKH